MAKKFNYKLPSMVALTLFGTAFTAHQANAAEIKWADVVIRPAVGDIGTTNTVAREATIKAGEIATLAKLSDIEQKIGKFQKL